MTTTKKVFWGLGVCALFIIVSSESVLAAPGNTVAIGATHGCAVVEKGKVSCWGLNKYAQLGNGSSESSNVPVEVKGVTGAVAVVVGGVGGVSCALIAPKPEKNILGQDIKKTGYDLNCWGSNNKGMSGGDGTYNGVRTPHLVPIWDFVYKTDKKGQIVKEKIKGKWQSVIVEKIGVEELVIGYERMVARMSNGKVKTWGDNNNGILGWRGGNSFLGVVSGFQGAVSIAASGFSCAVLKNGSAWCLGNNAYGALGLGDTKVRYTAEKVKDLEGAKQIVAAGFSTCALLSDGSVKCWGNNSSGELGIGSLVSQLTPVAVQGLKGKVTRLAAGGAHVCALMEDNTAQCWGQNNLGQIGDGTGGKGGTLSKPAPTEPKDLGKVREIAAGGGSVCAVKENKETVCWGDNSYGQLGDGNGLVPDPINKGKFKQVINLAPVKVK
jgi:alpha-tubulin suppressor-like RCC1 family protein